jgi:uncharacterized protein YbaA (DUF1428 family)
VIHHVVMFRWKDDIPEGQDEVIAAALRAMAAEVGTARSYHCGPDAGAGESTNFDFAVAATFDDLDGWRAYDQDAEHGRIRTELVRPWLADRGVVQFEA